MKQVFLIHGGDSYESYDEYLISLRDLEIDYERLKLRRGWKDWLVDQMPEADILAPQFPNRQNAQYDEWRILFEKLIPFFGEDTHLVGHSLGAMFLAKYLQESPLDKPISQLILVAAGYNSETEGYGNFRVSSATEMHQSAHQVHLMHSSDDLVVPYTELDKFVDDLPMATVHRFTDRGHFNTETFPELLDILNQKQPSQ